MVIWLSMSLVPWFITFLISSNMWAWELAFGYISPHKEDYRSPDARTPNGVARCLGFLVGFLIACIWPLVLLAYIWIKLGSLFFNKPPKFYREEVVKASLNSNT